MPSRPIPWQPTAWPRPVRKTRTSPRTRESSSSGRPCTPRRTTRLPSRPRSRSCSLAGGRHSGVCLLLWGTCVAVCGTPGWRSSFSVTLSSRHLVIPAQTVSADPVTRVPLTSIRSLRSFLSVPSLRSGTRLQNTVRANWQISMHSACFNTVNRAPNLKSQVSRIRTQCSDLEPQTSRADIEPHVLKSHLFAVRRRARQALRLAVIRGCRTPEIYERSQCESRGRKCKIGFIFWDSCNKCRRMGT